ncbi:hypothetical protein B0E45_14595 [Sinorhizobium sp. A49]|uniref:ABC-three component system protein n=1 Tax=Sinorhizobium sp. A49 TaxID=1945861 RepID=UPI000985C962|nr:ABC-three component system protein [Sinorhizobium sp. A49]OOG70027.1 hypothetical protein B0E45_14595 [Sinorhizobium sp. A49]
MYVLGCFDRRITFYSQQVRALSLVHALHELGYLQNAPQIAVIGAGAAGLTAAAAAALASAGRVVLFETARELVPLQSATARRKLDPHIYDWPRDDATDAIANLPILDWEAGASRSVRQDVVLEFEDIAGRVAGRLEKRTGHQVKQIRGVGTTYEIIYDRLDNAPGGGPAQNLSDRFDMVFLAIGFGLEPRETIRAIADTSYWSDAGVPTAEFAARPTPRFFISGNGDGGLIDFVAAASRDFDHRAMIRLIAEHPGIQEIAGDLVAIDARARDAQTNAVPFDMYAVYEAEIRERIEAIGLVGEVARRLRPGVQLTLQTEHPEIFTVNTSALNRLAAFATIKACETSDQWRFTHIHGQNVTRVEAYTPDAGQPAFLLDCEGTRIEADEVIIRRGPKRAEARRPFIDVLGDYETTHSEWLQRHGDATLVPTLSNKARAFFDERAKLEDIPLSRRRQRQAAANLPVSFQLRVVGSDIRWSGALSKENIAEPWDADRLYEVILPGEPADLGPVTSAILRMACHARQVTLHADPAHWRDHVRRLSADSLHAAGMSTPRIVGGNPGGAAQNPETISAVRLGRQLHEWLDRWILNCLHQHLAEFLRTGADPGRAVGLAIAPDLRQMMADTWDDWRDAFEDDPALLNHFLRLMVCATDEDDDLDAAQVLVGPNKLPAIICGTAVSLAIASSWEATAPNSTRPGNLRRRRGGATEWTGHGCAADLINGKAMPLCAGSFMWQTNFVILTVQGTIELAKRAEIPFAQVESGQPAFTETDGSGPVVMWISAAFSNAVETGADALSATLADVENRHFARLTAAIQKVEEPA